MPRGVAQPMDPLYLMNFMSNQQINARMLTCFMAAVRKYHRALAAAAKTLDADLKACVNPPVALRRTMPAIKKTAVAKKKPAKKKK
jgi:hypothetical protein